MGDNVRVPRTLPAPGELADRWSLDPEVVYLNHGSFGAAPRAVIAAQDELRARLEAGPVRFFEDHYPAALDEARRALAAAAIWLSYELYRLLVQPASIGSLPIAPPGGGPVWNGLGIIIIRGHLDAE